MNPATEAPVLSTQGQLHVGAWTLEPDLNHLSAAGKTVKVEPKAMAVLLPGELRRAGGQPGDAACGGVAGRHRGR